MRSEGLTLIVSSGKSHCKSSEEQLFGKLGKSVRRPVVRTAMGAGMKQNGWGPAGIYGRLYMSIRCGRLEICILESHVRLDAERKEEPEAMPCLVAS